MPSARRNKFAGCNAHEDKKIISMPLLKMCMPKRHAKQVPTALVRLNEATLLSGCIARPSAQPFWQWGKRPYYRPAKGQLIHKLINDLMD